MGISARALEQSIGCSNGVISRCINKGTDISSQWVSKIIDTYSEVNPTWLLTGKGEMLKTKDASNAISSKLTAKATSKSSKNNQDAQHNIQETRPRIPFDAAAGKLTAAISSVGENECERIPVIPTFPKYDFTIIARGDSMEPQYLSGDELACLFIKETSFIQWGRAHVLDTAQGIVVKRIFDAGNSILCKSNNPAYPDFKIDKSEIYHLALVVGYIRIE